jgi:hypothetical protein
MKPSPFVSSARRAVCAATPPSDFPARVRAALRPLLADDELLERAARKIQAMQSANWKFMEHSHFFDFDRKVEHVVAHFSADGLTRPAFIRAAVKRVTLFFQNPETLIANIEGVTDHFAAHGLTHRAYLRAAVTQPQLFFQRPATLIRNIEQVVDHFRDDGLTCEKYVRAAVRQPSLFARRPAAIIRTVGVIMSLHSRGLMDLPEPSGARLPDRAVLLEFLLKRPPLLCLSVDNIALRATYARLTRIRSASTLLRTPRHRIERELAEALSLGADEGGTAWNPRGDGGSQRPLYRKPDCAIEM